MTRRLRVYRLLLFAWGALLLGALYWRAAGPVMLGVLCLVLAGLVLGIQALLVRCPRCGARPGLWLLAGWMLFLQVELYVADVLLLKACPRCAAPLDQL